jgi:hypothetical protein
MKPAAKSKTQTKQKTKPHAQPPVQTPQPPVQTPQPPVQTSQPPTQTSQPPPLEQPRFSKQIQNEVKPEIIYDVYDVYDSGEETETEEKEVYKPQVIQNLQNIQNLQSSQISQSGDSEDTTIPSIIPSEITLEAYLKLFEQKIKLEHEVIQLKNKLFEAQVKLENKVVNKPNATELKDKLIDLLIESPLNIESIPDDVERQIYRFILEQLDTGVQVATKCCVIM